MLSRACLAFLHLLQVTVCLSQLTCNNITSHRHYHLLPPTSRCGRVLSTPRIMGGRDAVLGQFPWMALLLYKDKLGMKQKFCGGSVISSKYVLTAAHCINRRRRTNQLVVRLGEHDTSTVRDCKQGRCAPAPVEHAVEKRVIHDKYVTSLRGYMEYDIALLRVKGRIRFNDFVQPVCLPFSCASMGEQLGGVSLTACGWGNTLDVPTVSRKKALQHVKVRGVSLASCQEAWPRRVTSLTLCAGGLGGRDACLGDSGGPLLHLNDNALPLRYEVVGVVSYGDLCEENADEKPGVYTRVGAFLPWILDHIHE